MNLENMRLGKENHHKRPHVMILFTCSVHNHNAKETESRPGIARSWEAGGEAVTHTGNKVSFGVMRCFGIDRSYG